MSSYTFSIVVNKVAAFDKYIRSNVIWGPNFDSVSSNPTIVMTINPLSEQELIDLTIYVNAYVDPEVFLEFDHAESSPMHTHFISDYANISVDGQAITQTYIYQGRDSSNPIVLDGLKTIIEYRCLNVQNFLNITNGSIHINLYDTTRQTSVASQDIELGQIALDWHGLAQTGSTSGSTMYRSVLFGGLAFINPDHDCVWQIRCSRSRSEFDFRCNGMQYLYYYAQ